MKPQITILQGPYAASLDYISATGEPFFKFCLAYTEPHMTFEEIDRFLWESRHEMTRFKNRYEGHVLVDLSAYNDRLAHELSDYFNAFLYFLRGNPEYIVTFTTEEKCSDSLREALERHFTLEIITLEGAENKKSPRIAGFTAD